MNMQNLLDGFSLGLGVWLLSVCINAGWRAFKQIANG